MSDNQIVISDLSNINYNSMLLYALDTFSNSVYVFDLENKVLVDNFSTSRHPVDVAIDSNNNLIYVTNEYDNSISVFSINSTE